MSRAIAVISPSSLENWNWKNCWTRGIGGSETSHIQMSDLLKNRGFDVHSFTPTDETDQSPAGVTYRPVSDFDPKDFKVVIDYRYLPLLDYPKVVGQKVWFVAQDVEYSEEATEERLERVDRYLCLCKTHSDFTQSRLPALRGKTYITANGVRSALLDDFDKTGRLTNPVTGAVIEKPRRLKNRLIYPSSPDRGLKLLLENWFRIKEKVPDAELHISYGLDNCLRIIALMQGNDWRVGFVKEMEQLFQQPGVTFTGRLNQVDLYREWFEASVFLYTNDFAETFCTNIVDSMATGCWPVSNNLWAVGENMQRIGAGDLFYGVPQKSALVRSYMVEKACERLNDGVLEINRQTMAEKARRVYNWENVADQWARWLAVDLEEA